MTPREEFEARITALLLGELPAEEADSLRQVIAQDSELSRLHNNLKQAIGLVREAGASPGPEPLANPEVLKLSPERRAALLKVFKVIRPRELRKERHTKVARREWAAVAAMVAGLIAVSVMLMGHLMPRFRARRMLEWTGLAENLELAGEAPESRRQNEAVLTVTPRSGDEMTEKPTPLVAIIPRPAKPGSVGALPENQLETSSFSLVTDASMPAPPARLPLLMLPDPSDARPAGERSTRQFAAIALPVTAGDAPSAGLEDKKDGLAGRSVIDLNQSLFAGGAFTPAPGKGGRGGVGRGGGGAGLGAGIKPGEYAGVSIAGGSQQLGRTDSGMVDGVNPGGTGNLTITAESAVAAERAGTLGPAGGLPTAPVPNTKPADGFSSFASGIAPVPAPAVSTADAELTRKRFSVLAAQDDGGQLKETDLAQRVATNPFVARFPTSVGDPAWPETRQFGSVPVDAGQTANVLQRSEGFIAPTLEPEALGVPGYLSDSVRLNVNGPADGLYRFDAPDPRAAGTKDAREAEMWEKEKAREFETRKKLGDVDMAWKLNYATNATFGFDTEGKDIVRDLPRGSGRKADEKAQAAQQLAEVDVARRDRVGIALPQLEHGENREKLRVATGPIVVSETTANPATGLPVEKQSDVGVAMQEATRRSVGRSPATEAAKEPAPQIVAVEKSVEAKNRPTAQPAGEPAIKGSTEVAALTRELDNLRAVRDKVAERVMQEKADASIPKTGIVEIIDRAESESSKKPTVLERVRKAVSGGVERSARITVQKDATDIQGLGVGAGRSTSFDPYWVQTESEKIQSKSVLDEVATRLKLNQTWAETHGGGTELTGEETYRLLKKKVDVGSDPNSGLIDIRVKTDSPDEAARIANTIAEVYRDTRTQQSEQLSARGAEALSEELVRLNTKIESARKELERRKQEGDPEPVDANRPKLAATAAIPQPEVTTADNAFSTFSLNVSDVSFKLAAASLEKGQMPDPATVRSEEFINAFDYRDPEPQGSAPVAFTWERARYPFAHDRDLLRFSVKTAASGRQPGRPLNLVLLLDNSGSMERADRVRIRQECLRVLAGQLQPQDRVSVVAFARTSRLWVDGLRGSQAGELSQRVGNLAPEGGTNLEDAMNVAYQTALRHFLANGVNRVVLLTDGAANLGDVEPESLKKKVEAHRKQGVALDCFGIGWDGLNDELLEALSRNGDGRYGFVNTPEAATSEFASQIAGALKVAASDVKVQVEWNPRRVIAFRQIGYAKHQLKKEQFHDNTVDAAEIGAAEAGNALYVAEVNPRGEGPLASVRVRFKVPATGDYREHEWAVPYEGMSKPLEQSSPALRLAASASAFSEWLVSSPYAAEVTPDKLLGHLSGVPEIFPADPRPKKLEWMIRQAKSVAGK